MKKLLSFFTVLALTGAGLFAQSNTNAFVVTAPSPVPITQVVTTTTSTLTVRLVNIDPVGKRITIYFVGVAKPTVISGADFAGFQGTFQGTFSTALSAYLAAHPPTP
jgi:hypothetical protein